MSLSSVDLSRIVSNLAVQHKVDRILQNSFTVIYDYLLMYLDRLSKRNGKKSNLANEEDVTKLASQYFKAYQKSDLPALSKTVPDQMVSIVMQAAYGYSLKECDEIKLTHQQSMCAENAVGALLERYIDSVLRNHNWHWCCGSIVKSIDFVRQLNNGKWCEVQIKNRNNSENSSSSTVRKGTDIKKWFRTFSNTGKTNWENLPELMRGHGLSETDFKTFVTDYLRS